MKEEKTEDIINKDRIPQHIAIIMDGNGRWAKQRGYHRTYGHKNAIGAVKQTVQTARKLGVKYLTLYTFSEENWERPQYEVNLLMKLLVKSINTNIMDLVKNDIQLNTIGDTNKIPKSVYKTLEKAIKKTEICKNLLLTLALSYSSKSDIIQAMNKIIQNDALVEKHKKTPLTTESFSQYLHTSNIPNPELLIRTGGEIRLSNFMLWEMAYTELYFTSVLWPDFTEESFLEAIKSFQGRERRFGKVLGISTKKE